MSWGGGHWSVGKHQLPVRWSIHLQPAARWCPKWTRFTLLEGIFGVRKLYGVIFWSSCGAILDATNTHNIHLKVRSQRKAPFYALYGTNKCIKSNSPYFEVCQSSLTSLYPYLCWHRFLSFANPCIEPYTWIYKYRLDIKTLHFWLPKITLKIDNCVQYKALSSIFPSSPPFCEHSINNDFIIIKSFHETSATPISHISSHQWKLPVLYCIWGKTPLALMQ